MRCYEFTYQLRFEAAGSASQCMGAQGATLLHTAKVSVPGPAAQCHDAGAMAALIRHFTGCYCSKRIESRAAFQATLCHCLALPSGPTQFSTVIVGRVESVCFEHKHYPIAFQALFGASELNRAQPAAILE